MGKRGEHRNRFQGLKLTFICRYDPKINPAVIDSFASAAFRFGHSLLPTAVERWSKAHKFIGE